jgi:hypothetical protein
VRDVLVAGQRAANGQAGIRAAATGLNEDNC